MGTALFKATYQVNFLRRSNHWFLREVFYR